MTQAKRIIKYIEDFGGISTMEAFKDLGITRLSARIFELKKKGYSFDTKMIRTKNRYDEPVSYAFYSFTKNKK